MARSRPQAAATSICIAIAIALSACGGSDGRDSPPGGSPAPGGGQNACAAAASLAPPSRIPPDPARADRKRFAIDGTPRWRVLDALWTHRQHLVRRRAGLTPGAGGRAADIGEIAVLQDEGELIVPPNPYDLRSIGLRFTRNATGGYDVHRIDGAFRQALGSALTLADDDSRPVPVPFAFSFYGRDERQAFVNSDGNITFGAEDRASTERNVARMLTGPPRISPFFADLDPSAGGQVYVLAAAGEYTVTWCGVRGFDSEQTTTVQTTLLPDGVIEMKFGASIGLGEAVVGLSPGRSGDFQPVDLSDPGPTAGGGAAVGERFADSQRLDVVELARKFYRTHADRFDQLVIWTDAPIVRDSFAYETTVANEIRGIGIDLFDASREFGSAGTLRSYAVMDWIGKYPDNPAQKFLGENTTLSVLGQEVGHRWLAFFNFRDHTGRRSDVILGRGEAHWSFFFDSDASVMEGNDIEDLGGGAFRTVAAVERYSLLDQYAMGLVEESQVPAAFYVQDPVNVVPGRDRESGPQVGVTFNGTRRDVLIQDIIAIHGPRVPRAAESPKVHRQAFLYVVGRGRTPQSSHVAKIDRIRREWETFFRRATDGRMRVETRLR